MFFEEFRGERALRNHLAKWFSDFRTCKNHHSLTLGPNYTVTNIIVEKTVAGISITVLTNITYLVALHL